MFPYQDYPREGSHCVGKAAHRNRERASVHANRLRKHRIKNREVGTYKCSTCGYWHVGGQWIKAKQPYVRRKRWEETDDSG